MSTTHPAAAETWRRKRAEIFRASFAPTPRLKFYEWADDYRYLSSVNSNESGRWRTGRTPWVRGPLDAIQDPLVVRVVIQKPAQMSYTEGIIGNVVGFNIHLRPRSMVVVQPSDGDAKDWSKDKFFNLVESTPVLRERVSDVELGRKASSTMHMKSFPGGFLKVVGGTSPKSLRRTSAGWIIVDEADGLPPSAGREGDPLDIVLKRATTFDDAKQIIGSTPTILQTSRIMKAIGDCSIVFDLQVPCPHCASLQTLKWGGRDTPYGMRFNYETVKGKKRVARGSVAYECATCHALISESDKYAMGAAHKWISEDGTELYDWLALEQRGESVGFRIGPALISPFAGCAWERLTQEFLDAESDPDGLRLQVFYNTRLGEAWDERQSQLDPQSLAGRAEDYGADVPNGVGILTAMVDVHPDRLELEVDGWGAGLENWTIAHHRIYGDVDQPFVWQTLEALRTRIYRHASGAQMRIAVMFIDCGDGGTMVPVFRYIRGKETAGVFAAKGDEGRGPEPFKRLTKPNKWGVKPFTVKVDGFKDSLFRRLRVEKPGPGYIHFCKPNDAGTPDAEYFAQFGREIPFVEKGRGGGIGRRGYKTLGRNESIDLKVGCHSALLSIPGILERLGDMAAALSERRAAPVMSAARRRRVISRGIE